MALHDDIAILNRLNFLKGVDQDALRLIAFGADHITITNGRVIVEKGGYINYALVLISGEVAIYNEQLDQYDYYDEQGTIFAEQAMLSDRFQSPRHIEASKRSEFIRLRKELLYRVMEEYPMVAQKLRDYYAQKIKDYTADLKGQNWVR